MNKKAVEGGGFSAIQLILLLIAIILILFMIAWYAGLGSKMTEIINEFFK